jgi:hypothetical protein
MNNTNVPVDESSVALRNGGGSEDGDISDQEETTYSDQPFMVNYLFILFENSLK